MTSDPMFSHGPPLAAWILAGVKSWLPPAHHPCPQMSSTPGPWSGPLSPAPASPPGQQLWLWDDFQAQSNHTEIQAPTQLHSLQSWAPSHA